MTRIIDTVSANCQDCYRCVRVCPLNAIRVEGGQARVDSVLCVQCGTCVRECPQGAKIISPSLDAVRRMAAEGETLAASVAPSFAAYYGGWRARRLPAALRLLGFSSVSETAEGAKAVAVASKRARDSASITTCCPAVVSYVEKYRPHLLPLLMPIVSPMVAHGRMLKERLGKQAKVVFIGPCAAKKGEALRPEAEDAIDAVLTFEELEAWMREEEISLATCLESDFETCGEPGDARLFALEGGLLKAAGIACDVGSADVLRVSGPDEVIRLLDTPVSQWGYDIVEPLFCKGGCVGGPCMPHGKDVFSAARDLIAYFGAAHDLPLVSPAVPLDAAFSASPVDALLSPVAEAEIQRILESTGKGCSSQQLDCGACGYKTCRENAIAVARGLAEPDMCVSYTRKRAERRADHIIETSPNGIVVVDRELRVVHMNARFQRMFGCESALIGQSVSRAVDPDGFERLLTGATGTQEAIRTKQGIRYQELVFSLPGDEEMTGIYVDVSANRFDEKQVDLIKDQSLKHARELLRHQIRFSQEMAHYLGKSTAQTEELVRNLMDMYAEDAPR